jgi:hypothetical protein
MPILSNVQFNELPPWMHEPYRNMVMGAERYAQQPYAQYAGERISPIEGEMKTAHELASRGIGEERAILGNAENQAMQGVRPFHENAAQYMNPYQQHVVRQIAEEGNRNFAENVLPALEAKFVRLGQHGGTRHADLSLRAARDLQHEIMNRQQQALAQGYQQAGQMYNAQQARALEGAGQLGNIAAARQGARFADISALENIGRYRQQQQQAVADVRYQNWLREQEHPMYRMQQQAAMMQGMPSQGINQSYYQTPATPAMNVIGQLGPLAGAIWGTRMMGGGR